MPFTIPNAVDAEDVTQAQPDARDFRDMIVAAMGGTGCISGCAVTAQGTPNMTLAVASGSVAVASAVVSVTAGNVTIAAADAGLARFDLVVVDNAGVKSVVTGTPSTGPVFPDPAGKAVLCAVRVPAGATSINSQKLVDKRVPPFVIPAAIPPATLAPFAGTVAPAGWLLCDGSAQSRTTYSALYAVVGTSYGAGDGSTTFNIPDLRGRIPIGMGTHADVASVGLNDGQAVGTRRARHAHTNGLTLPNHTHANSLTLPNHVHSHSFTLPDHGHGHSFALPNHSHAHSLALPNHTHSNTFTLPNHTHSNTFSLPAHTHGAGSLALPTHSHNHSLTLPNHAHSVNDPGHTHGTVVTGINPSGGQAIYGANDPSPGSIITSQGVLSNTTGISVGAPTSTPVVNGSVDTPTSLPAINGSVGNILSIPAIDGAVGNPTSNPAPGGSIGNPTTNPGISGTVDNPTSNPTIPGAVGSVTSTPTISGGVGNPTSLPTLGGSVDNPTTNPAISGTIGQTGMTDSSAYLVVNYLIKT